MTVPETSAGRRFQWPADYYSSATPDPVVPRGVTFGCGAGALFVIAIVFLGGSLVTGQRFAEFMDFGIGMEIAKMRAQFGADVTAARKKSLEDEIAKLRENLRTQKISIPKLQPFTETLARAMSDKRITAEEAQRLEELARRINQSRGK